ncbi:MAG TPA: aminoacyl-tRNA hydrolase [Candidatus Ruthenibacterium avium]|uniref:Peptidyl-tRNA hydrolase n=1 Tax=Candidatus Ruthenibacterium avium TaxID=2838751 RepID=A0A9D2M111_9FIRM|nr:aminoacyl-tRNA hydrolase [Candidatus Ruthenibacterium avium]
MWFQKSSAVEYLIVGLGNPGKQYEHTRHNAGFDALDDCADRWGISVVRSKFDALTGTGSAGGAKAMLMKPQTFMNLSGQAVKKAVDFYKLPPERVIVLFDDISLEPGKLRLRKTGSAGGHNGIKSIIAAIGQDFPRVKIGVGKKPHPDYDLADWVLSRFSAEDQKAIAARHQDIAAALELIMNDQFELAQSRYNG